MQLTPDPTPESTPPAPEAGTPTASQVGSSILQHAPLEASELVGWLGMLDSVQMDRVWIAAIADVLTRDACSIAELLFVLRYVRGRYQQEILRVGQASGSQDKSVKAAAAALQTLWRDMERGAQISAGHARRRARLAAEAKQRTKESSDVRADGPE